MALLSVEDGLINRFGASPSDDDDHDDGFRQELYAQHSIFNIKPRVKGFLEASGSNLSKVRSWHATNTGYS